MMATLRSAGFVFFGEEVATKDGGDAQHGEEIPRHFRSVYLFGSTVTGQVERRVAGRRHVGKGVVALLPVVEVPGCRCVLRETELRYVFVHLDQAVLIGELQRPDKDSVREAEDRSGRANAQGERKDSHNGEAGRLPQLAKGVTKIL